MAKENLAADTDLFRVYLSVDNSVGAELSPWIIGIALVALILFFLARWYWKGTIFTRPYEIDSAEFGFGDSKVTFRPNMSDKAVAYKIWVELSTRKIGLPIDFDDDVICEIYDSWFNFFGVTRELIKEIPVSKVRSSSTKQIIVLSIEVLNTGLRPHLTKWQARFRRWYEYRLSIDVEAKFHPQDVQRDFPQFEALVSDMKAVNEKLIKYREKMYNLVHA